MQTRLYFLPSSLCLLSLFTRLLPGDIQLLIDQRIAFLREYWGEPDAAAEAALRGEMRVYLDRALPAGEYVSWYALIDGVVAGIGGMAVVQRPGSFRVADGRCGYIMNMYTPAPYRRRGIAQQVLDRLVESGREMGLHFLSCMLRVMVSRCISAMSLRNIGSLRIGSSSLTRSFQSLYHAYYHLPPRHPLRYRPAHRSSGHLL